MIQEGSASPPDHVIRLESITKVYGSGDAAVVAQNLIDRMIPNQAHLSAGGQREQAVLQDLFRTQFIATVDQGDVRGDIGEVQGLLHGGIAATHHGHIIRGLDGPPEKLLYRQIFLDTAQLARIVMAMPEVDPNRVGTIGGSQGGALSLVCAALEPPAWQLPCQLCGFMRSRSRGLSIVRASTLSSVKFVAKRCKYFKLASETFCLMASQC